MCSFLPSALFHAAVLTNPQIHSVSGLFSLDRPFDRPRQTTHSCGNCLCACQRVFAMTFPFLSDKNLSGLIQIYSINILFSQNCRPAMFSVPCVFIHSKSPRRLLPILSCVYLALYSQNACVYRCLCVCVCVCVCVCEHARLELSLGTKFCALKIPLLLLYIWREC